MIGTSFFVKKEKTKFLRLFVDNPMKVYMSIKHAMFRHQTIDKGGVHFAEDTSVFIKMHILFKYHRRWAF